MRVEGSWSSDEIDVTFTSNAQRVDYGVPHSPSWVEYTDYEIQGIWIWSIKVDESALPAKLLDLFLEKAEEIEDWC